ncbi:MAG: glycoside hydrolase family 105 protein [Cyclobacteriaceae bacterium]
MKKVCDWQVTHPVERNDGNGMAWARSAFYAGIMATYQATGEEKYLNQVLRWGTAKQWKLDNRYDHADDHASGQSYLEAYLERPNPTILYHAQKTFDKLIAENRVGRELYWWADALFMSPPVAARLYETTNDEKYIDFLNTMWWDTHDFLYDPEERLFFQSHWFFRKKTPNGRKTFWARANGWVMAGTVRVLQYLPTSNDYHERYVELLQEMAEAVAAQQQEDGLWRPSLLDVEEAPFPETSSSSFFVYAIAWGINNGYLPEETYLPVVTKAWEALVGAIHPNGKLGWVQPGGSKPDEVTYDNYQEFGAGSFLLAGSEVLKLNR